MLGEAGSGGIAVAVFCAAVVTSTVGGGLCVGLSCSCLCAIGTLHDAMSCSAAPAMRSADAAPISLDGGICAGCARLRSYCIAPCSRASSSSSLDSMGSQVELWAPSSLALLGAVHCETSLAGHTLGVDSISSLRRSSACAALMRCCSSSSSLFISSQHRLKVISA